MKLTGSKKKVLKGWGHELIWASNDLYCGKLLVFERAGAEFSMHFHATKDETWLVTQGKFRVSWCDTSNASYHDTILNVGDVWHNAPLQPHRLEALESNSIIVEVSTADDVNDNHRISPGDSQGGKN